MKIVSKMLDAGRPLFTENGRLAPFHPVFAAVENLFFAPDAATTGPPFMRDPVDLKRYMTMVILALFPCFLSAVYFFGWRILAMILVS